MGRILAIDDDRLMHGTGARTLRSEGDDVAAAGDAQGASGRAGARAAAPRPMSDPKDGVATQRRGSHLVDAALRRAAGPLRRLAILLAASLERRAARRRLPTLSDHMLRDMGVSRFEVERATRAAWRGK